MSAVSVTIYPTDDRTDKSLLKRHGNKIARFMSSTGHAENYKNGLHLLHLGEKPLKQSQSVKLVDVKNGHQELTVSNGGESCMRYVIDPKG